MTRNVAQNTRPSFRFRWRGLGTRLNWKDIGCPVSFRKRYGNWEPISNEEHVHCVDKHGWQNIAKDASKLVFHPYQGIQVTVSEAWLQSSLNYIHDMRDFCGFVAVNDADSGRKPLRKYKTERGEISLWRLSWTFVVAVETKSHLLSATDALLGGKFSTSPTTGRR